MPETVLGDQVRLQQVLLNLMGNAIKFTHKGRVVVSADLISETDESVLVGFAVKDTGIGIPEDKISTVFDKFAQADASTTRRYGGSGLGLTISAQLVELMHGELRATSQPGLGSVFAFELEFKRHTPRKSIDVTDAPSDDRSTGTPSRAKILIVEDSEINQVIASKQLEALGCRVEIAADGAEALIALQSADDFDLILMDCQMPNMDGMEATRQIRRRETQGGRRIPIVAMTANALTGDRDRCLAAGMDDYFTKPLEKATIAAIVDKYVPEPIAESPLT